MNTGNWASKITGIALETLNYGDVLDMHTRKDYQIVPFMGKVRCKAIPGTFDKKVSASSRIKQLAVLIASLNDTGFCGILEEIEDKRPLSRDKQQFLIDNNRLFWKNRDAKARRRRIDNRCLHV